MNSRSVTVEFVGFDRSEINYSLKVIKDIALAEAGLVEGSNPDIVVCAEDLVSVRKVMEFYPESTIRILFNAELGSIDFNVFDYVIGWDFIEDSARYARMHPALGIEKSPFMSGERLEFADRPMSARAFCCFLASNGLAHPMRDKLFKRLNEARGVDSWGRHLNNSGEISNSSSGLSYELEKMELESGYKFTLAIENAHFPGYMSEKVFSGAKAGAVPIYWGNPRVGEDINLERIISLHEFKDIDAAISEILELEKDTERLERIVALPIMTPRQKERIEESRQAIVELFLHAAESARRSELHRPVGTTTYAREYVLVSALRREEWVLRRKATISRILRKFGLLELFFKAQSKFRLYQRKGTNRISD